MDNLIGANLAGGPAAADLVKDSSQQTFKADVIDASMEVPVIVDFWAPWCGPCKQLGPVLEKVVKEARGAVRMVKVNVDENQALAGQLRIQSIPAVFAFFQGRPVDAFQGAQPEGQLKAFVARLAKLGGGEAGASPIDEALEHAEAAHEAGDHATAAEIFGQILEHEPENVKAIGGIVRCLIALGELEQAAEFLGRTPKDKLGDPAIAAAKAQLDVVQAGQKAAGQTDALRARIDANPKDHEARIELAQALFATGDKEGAVDQLLDSIRINRAHNEEAARKQLVTFFEALGPTDPLTLSARRRLSSLLFS
ncbi:thioredoxin [Dongia sp.]|jgi:putative thioredoxin|uniref:thioredoxin n=1 Tax=Dongia sp. TaxID=1977262 RepID=UPI0035B3C26C